jgi:hypothetical protein
MSLLPAEEVGSQQVAAKNGNKYDALVGIVFITLRSIECKELPLWAGTVSGDIDFYVANSSVLLPTLRNEGSTAVSVFALAVKFSVVASGSCRLFSRSNRKAKTIATGKSLSPRQRLLTQPSDDRAHSAQFVVGYRIENGCLRT